MTHRAHSAANGPADVPYDFNEPPADCADCGWPADSFACKARHVAIQHGWARGDH